MSNALTDEERQKVQALLTSALCHVRDIHPMISNSTAQALELREDLINLGKLLLGADWRTRIE